ncbi:hypothetical protein DT603_06295 [Pseudoxanthomonas gei]|uniref:Phosphatidate cytidylyltransferase n=2 Tax=Pseudoxanthomonas gei TaxID=1383030 RepID=A0ABX0ACW2_9GAMM|nr:hypothetical protein [Pseudoxanthomonas gei]
MSMMEGEPRYVAALLAAALVLGTGAYLFNHDLYGLVLLVCVAAVLLEAVHVAVLGKRPKRLCQLWAELKHALWSP